MFAALYIHIKLMTVYLVGGVAGLQWFADFCVPAAGVGGEFAVFCCGLRRVRSVCVVAKKWFTRRMENAKNVSAYALRYTVACQIRLHFLHPAIGRCPNLIYTIRT